MNTTSVARPGIHQVSTHLRAPGFTSTSEGRLARKALVAFGNHRPGLVDRLMGGRTWRLPQAKIKESASRRTTRWEIEFSDATLEQTFTARSSALASPIEIEPADFDTVEDGHTYLPVDILSAPVEDLECRRQIAVALWSSMQLAWSLRARAMGS